VCVCEQFLFAHLHAIYVLAGRYSAADEGALATLKIGSAEEAVEEETQEGVHVRDFWVSGGVMDYL
jgi:hypothetical protein